MARMLTVADVRRRAKRRLPRAIFDFVDGGAEDERTLRWNQTGFADLEFRPRVLVDVSRRDQATTVLGQHVALPILLGPAGLARLVHPQGEVAAARAAGRAGTAFGLSTGSSTTIEDVAAAADGPLWFQLYLWRDREVIEGLMSRAEASGYDVLCLTVDVPMVGQRERDLRNGMRIPPRITVSSALDAARRIRWVRDFLLQRSITFENFLGIEGAASDSATDLGSFVNRDMVNPAASWEDLAWVRDRWPGKLVVKGILTDEDARRAVDTGADGVVVSNHGGRQLDSAPATISVLPEIADAVGDRAEVFLDGGVRRGSDVVKAVALGARAVLLGRPWFYGLAADGEAGVLSVLEILKAEVDRTLALVGRPTLADLDPTVVRRRTKH